eukprot:5129071-Prymnesium_polylepis.1
MQAAIAREKQRREDAGFSDAVQAVQPKQAPVIDDGLIGALLEICRYYTSTVDGKTKVVAAPFQ